MFILSCFITHSGRPSFAYIRFAGLFSWASWPFLFPKWSFYFLNFHEFLSITDAFCAILRNLLHSRCRLTFYVFIPTWTLTAAREDPSCRRIQISSIFRIWKSNLREKSCKCRITFAHNSFAASFLFIVQTVHAYISSSRSFGFESWRVAERG